MSEEREGRTKERRTTFPMQRLKLEEPGADGRRRIQGYAAVFGNRDSYGDIIVKGAFERTLRERPDVKVLWQHDRTTPIGKQEAGGEDEFGLAVTGVLTPTTKVTGEVVPLLLDGVVNGLSIGYNVIEEDYSSDLDAWLLKDVELFEWSPVTFPANELATVTEVKDLDSRGALHAGMVARHAKALTHELGGFFGKDGDSDRRDDLPFDALAEVHTLIGGVLPGAGHGKAADAEAVERAFLEGGKAALEAINPTKE